MNNSQILNTRLRTMFNLGFVITLVGICSNALGLTTLEFNHLGVRVFNLNGEVLTMYATEHFGLHK